MALLPSNGKDREALLVPWSGSLQTQKLVTLSRRSNRRRRWAIDTSSSTLSTSTARRPNGLAVAPGSTFRIPSAAAWNDDAGRQHAADGETAARRSADLRCVHAPLVPAEAGTQFWITTGFPLAR